jgi:hypothetical protein
LQPHSATDGLPQRVQDSAKEHTLFTEVKVLQLKKLFVFHSDNEYIEECMSITVQFRNGERKMKRDSQGMSPVPVLWQAMSVKNISLKYIGRYQQPAQSLQNR